jgi:hypothetical protein
MPPLLELQYDTITDFDGASSSSAEPRKAPLDRQVHFAEYDEIVEIPHINDLSDEEVDGVWMTEDELRSIRRRCKDMVKMMEKDEEKARKKISCTRGIYEHTKQYIEKRDQIRGKIYEAVIAVQCHHDATGEYDEELLGELSRSYSAVSVLQAQVLALGDAAAAFQQ